MQNDNETHTNFRVFNTKESVSKLYFDLLTHTEHASESLSNLIDEKFFEREERGGKAYLLSTAYARFVNFGLFDYYWRTFGFNFEVKD